MLEVNDLCAWYDESQALHGMEFNVGEGEVVSLLGRNGAGKSTTMKSIMGLVKKKTGRIRFCGKELLGLRSDLIAKSGLALCPEERAIFSTLTVSENLHLPPKLFAGGLSVDEVEDMFPNLKSRSQAGGGRLSGGEQQMLAIGRILRTGARFLMLDEPTEGLAPVIVQQIGEIIRTLRTKGYTILLVEQNFRFATTVCDRHYFVEHGKIIDMISNAALQANAQKVHRYLGV